MSGLKLLAAGVGGLALGVAAAVSRPRYSFVGRTIVITGGSRGLGLALAREFGAEGAKLALIARDGEELERAVAQLTAAGISARGFACDVTRAEAVDATVAAIASAFGRVDVLVNNAGAIQVGPLENLTRQDFDAAMAIHFFGPLQVTLALLPHLRRRRGARIVNVASIGGKIAVPHLLPYCASKFALVGLSDGLRTELRRDGIRVTTVCPGLMRTGSPPNACFKGQYRKEYAWFAIADSLPFVSVSARAAARRIVAACRRGEARVTIGLPAKLAVAADALAPGMVARSMSALNRLLPEPGGDARLYTGWVSESPASRKWVSQPSRRATQENNQRVAVRT